MTDEVVRFEHASRVYGEGPSQVRAMDDVSLTIMRGEFVALVGPSGSGKSTLLNSIGCLDTPTSGIVRLDGRDVTALDHDGRSKLRAERIGFIFQSFNLIPVFTAYENIEFALQIQAKHTDVESKVTRMLERLGLATQAQRRPAQLSGGQQQRVAIGRALVKEPAIVLADEPTANLDRKTSNDIIALMRQMNEELHATFVFSTHDEHLMSHAKRVVRLVDGRIVSDEVVRKAS
jgi:putative ABC transport system ATP-binding protein